MPGIFLKHGDAYVSMTETFYDDEDVLQALIAQHPEMLADENAGQGQLLLVRREAGVNDQPDAGGRWSLDHLYVDGSGIPTLVEVKRSSDTRGRREVVAQMLDYASNAKTSFSPDRMAAWLDDEAQARGTTAAQTLSETLGVDDPEAFWSAVATNLAAERFRLMAASPKLQTHQKVQEEVVVEICELRNEETVVIGRVIWDGNSVVIACEDDDLEEALVGYTTIDSEPTDSFEDGESWVMSLPDSFDSGYFWARFAEAASTS